MRLLIIFSTIAVFSLVMFSCNSANSTNATKTVNKPTETKPAANADNITRIGLPEAKAAAEAGTAIIIDARDINAYNSEHIKGSISIPLSEIGNRIGELPKDKQLIFYCS